MKKEVMFLLLIISLSSFISAKNISLNYEQENCVNEEFNLKIELIDYPEDIYDVKIDSQVNGERIFRIYDNGKWKSTFYYIKEIISPTNPETFTLKSESYLGKAHFIVKIRNSEGDYNTFSGYDIEIIECQNNTEEESSDSNENITEENINNSIKNSTDNKDIKSFYPLDKNNSEKNSENEIQDSQITGETIVLNNPKDIKTPSNSQIKKGISIKFNKDLTTRLSLLGFSLLLGILFLLRNNKNKKYNKTEFNEENEF
ncbi:MAG: hypothetical protein ACOCUU_00340 [Nanoarchaeota archaeon]